MSLSQKWQTGLSQRESAKQAVASESNKLAVEKRATELISRIPGLISQAILKDEISIELGVFIGNEVPSGKGDYYPEREELKGAAVNLFDFCAKEGLHLRVGGEFKMSSQVWCAPYEIYICLKR